MAENNVKPEFPPILVIKKQNFENAFKHIISMLISQNKINSNDLMEVNKQISNWVITGMKDVDFENIKNKSALKNLVDDLWIEFYKDLNLKIKRHRNKFTKK